MGAETHRVFGQCAVVLLQNAHQPHTRPHMHAHTTATHTTLFTDRRRHNHRNQNIGMVATSVALLVLLLVDSTATLSARSAAPRRRRACASTGRNAAKDGDLESLRSLLADGSWNASEDRDRRGTSALHLAAGHGHVSFCEILLGSADCHHSTFLEVDDCNQEDATPLHFAVAGMRSRRSRGGQNGFGTGGHVGTAQALLQHGANPAACTVDGNSVVHWAAWAGGVPVLRLLCEGYADDVDLHALNGNGCSVAHWAASSGALASCVYLANMHRVSFAVRNHEGATPLSKAILHARPGVVRWLVESSRHEPTELAEAAAMAKRLAERCQHRSGTADAEVAERMQIARCLHDAKRVPFFIQ